MAGPLELQPAGAQRLSGEGEDRINDRMRDHPAVSIHAYADRNRLADLEHRVLRVLDPPLNLEGCPSTFVRRAVSAHRRALAGFPPCGKLAQARRGHAVAAVAPTRSSPTLRDELAEILRAHSGGWLTTTQLAAAVNERGRYHKRDGRW